MSFINFNNKENHSAGYTVEMIKEALLAIETKNQAKVESLTKGLKGTIPLSEAISLFSNKLNAMSALNLAKQNNMGQIIEENAKIAKIATDKSALEAKKIAEAKVNEARSINKIQKEWSEVTADMANTVTSWKEAEGDTKSQLLDKLKALTIRKKELETELNSAVMGKDKDVELVGALESVVNEGAVKQFETDFNNMVKNIKSGYGWIDPEFVADTWENSSDSIDFELVKAEIYNRLIKAGLLAYADEDDEESAGKKVKSLKELGIKESVVTEGIINISNKNVKGDKSKVDTSLIDTLVNQISPVLNSKPGTKLNEKSYREIIEAIAKSISGTGALQTTGLVFEGTFNEAEINSDDEFKESAGQYIKSLKELGIKESVVNEANPHAKPAGLSKEETMVVAQKFADAMSKVDKVKVTVNKRTLEEDSFDLDVDGGEFDGGSYNIFQNGNVMNMALPSNPVYGKKNDTVDTIAKNMKTFSTNESAVTEGKKYNFKDLAKEWDLMYAEDMKDEYKDFYKKVTGTYKDSVTKKDVAEIWMSLYGEDMKDEYSGFYNALNESALSWDILIERINK